MWEVMSISCHICGHAHRASCLLAQPLTPCCSISHTAHCSCFLSQLACSCRSRPIRREADVQCRMNSSHLTKLTWVSISSIKLTTHCSTVQKGYRNPNQLERYGLWNKTWNTYKLWDKSSNNEPCSCAAFLKGGDL